MNNRRFSKILPLVVVGFGLSGCDAINRTFANLDLDLRNNAGGLDTSNAVRSAVANRPEPDQRGVISYPNYQVAVARQNDTVSRIAARVGGDAAEIAGFNGLRPSDTLNRGEIVALPGSVAPPAAVPGTVKPIDITEIATTAIDDAPAGAGIEPAAPSRRIDGPEPVRHQVERGETAFSVARLYKVTPRALADWNGLDAELTVREGQYLLIPIVQDGGEVQTAAAASQEPGAGSPTPEPPSAVKPLPDPVEPARPAPVEPPKPAAAASKLQPPVTGAVLKPWTKGRSEWIEIAANPGTPVKAAADGTVAIISQDTDQKTIVVIRHANNLLTVYVNIDDIAVQKGDKIARGQQIAKVAEGTPSKLHFELREGIESIDPTPFLK